MRGGEHLVALCVEPSGVVAVAVRRCCVVAKGEMGMGVARFL